jgi:hypothetical protein
MSIWQDLQCFCPEGGWMHEIEHMKLGDKRGRGDCPAAGGKVLIDVETGYQYCTACGKTWKPEDMVFNCSCGRRIPTQYRDSLIVAASEAQVLGYDGALAYVLTTSGELVVVQRTYLTIRGSG